MYLDLLLFLCLAVNYFLLLFTAKMFHRNPGFWRLLAGGALGSLAVLVVLIPPTPGMIMSLTLLTPLVMVVVVFWPIRWPEICLLWGALFLLAFLTGGTVLALTAGNGFIFGSTRGIAFLLGACMLLYLLLGVVRPYFEERKWQKVWQMTLLVSWQGREKTVSAFLDTGNRLRDPFSQLPVIIINYRSLEDILPPAVYSRLADSSLEAWMVFQELDDLAMARYFTLVPFRGVGAGREVMLGFKPDAVVVSRGEERWTVSSQVVLGLVRRSFGPVAAYQALLPPELVKAG